MAPHFLARTLAVMPCALAMYLIFALQALRAGTMVECKVKSWDTDTGYLIGEIVASQANDTILTDGKVDLGKLKPIIFDPSFNVYRVVGEAVGHAFRDGLKLK